MEMPKPDENGYYHFVYKTTLEGSDKYYIGRRSTKNLNDGYVGSGKWIKDMKKAGRRSQLFRTILNFAKNKNQLCELEQHLLDIHNTNPNCMNISRCSTGVGVGVLVGEKNPNFGAKQMTSSVRQKISASLKDRFLREDNPRLGATLTEETKSKIRKTYRFYDSRGELYVTSNIQEFCKHNFLNRTIMGKLYHGNFYIRGVKRTTYKGWRSANPDLISAQFEENKNDNRTRSI